VLLCCQSTSDATAKAVGGTITASSSPTAAAQTISLNGSLNATITWPDRVKWNNNTTPTLIYNEYTSAFQTFRLTTVDTGLNYNAWEEMQSTAQQVSLWFWGRASYGTSGLNDRTRRSSPTQIPGQWSSKFFGSQSNLVAAIPKVDGTLWSWGYASGGNLGLNDNVARSSPTQVGTDTTWSQSSTGAGKQTLAIKTDGTLWSWGGNDFGDLGQNYAHENGRVSSPTQVGTGTDWKQVSADASKTSAFKTDGTLWVWGANGDGGLGLNKNNVPVSSPAQIPGTTWDSTTVTNVGDTYSGGCIKTDGTLWVWGRNQEGDLGQNKSGTVPQGGVYYSSPTQMGTGTDWASVSQCGNSGLGTKTDGTLWAWGRNNSGGLGQNNQIQYSSPVQIPGNNWSNDPQDISMQDLGSGNAWAIKTDGTLWVWGSKGSDGSLGQNQAPAQGTSVSSPIQIPGTNWAAIPGVSSNSYAVYAMKYSPSP
jgi:alpha-tubulin suppressor-like RCC1 family protein